MTAAWSTLTLILTALSLGPSFAHVLEAPPRLAVWPPELWIDATVRHGQFALFRLVGAPVDVAAIVAAVVLAVMYRGGPGFGASVAAAAQLALGLAAWFALVAPANTILAGWAAGAAPSDFASVRMRWETGHMVVAALKLLAFAAMAWAVAGARTERNT